MIHRVRIRGRRAYLAHAKSVRAAARNVLALEAAGPGEMSIVLTDDHEVRSLNREFAGADHPTDVLAFVDGQADPDTGLTYFGDVVIAVPVAARQADAARHSLDDELTLLAVHGALHLLGYDHARKADKKRMWARQRHILHSLDKEQAARRSGHASNSS